VKRRKPQTPFRVTLITAGLAFIGLGLIWLVSRSGAIERIAALLMSPMAPN
jgi:hypothetical protein